MGLTLADSPLAYPDQALAFDSKDKAAGLGFVLGLHYAASPKLDLAAHYESKVKLDFETTVNKDDIGLALDGAKSRRDLPAVLYLGAGYRWSAKLEMLVDFNYYFQSAADWGTHGRARKKRGRRSPATATPPASGFPTISASAGSSAPARCSPSSCSRTRRCTIRGWENSKLPRATTGTTASASPTRPAAS